MLYSHGGGGTSGHRRSCHIVAYLIFGRDTMFDEKGGGIEPERGGDTKDAQCGCLTATSREKRRSCSPACRKLHAAMGNLWSCLGLGRMVPTTITAVAVPPSYGLIILDPAQRRKDTLVRKSAFESRLCVCVARFNCFNREEYICFQI